MAEVLDLSPDAHNVVHRAVEALTEGQLVAFPTETVYGIAASARVPEAVEQLRKGKGRPEGKPLTLAIAQASQALDWVPDLSPLGQRLARRCWPGPVTLVLRVDNEHGFAGRLPESVRRRVCPEGNLGLRVPDHEIILEALRRLPDPVVLTSANRSGEAAATTAAEVIQALGDELALVIDGGPTRYGQPSTVVQVNGNSWKMLRQGVVSEADLKRQAAKLILFVCTGNTCRSPMAEALCKKLLAERLGCAPEELLERGLMVLSAGLAALTGGGAAPEAIEAAGELGADLTGHISRLLTPGLAAQADLVIAMTQSHVLTLASRFPALESRLRLLSPDGNELPDPIGCEPAVYRECARQILNYLKRLLPELSE
jgi:tRNA threonylcarbamoyl adenosine modification protein (Sua5/YciO/YrdC/YwlC family)